MNHRLASVAASVAALVVASGCVALVIVGLVSAVMAGSTWSELVNGWAVAEASNALGFSVVGGFLAWRRPSNPIGWLFLLLLGVGSAMSFAGSRLDQLAELGRGTAWLVEVAHLPFPSVPFSGPLALVFLTFPHGRPASARWWPVIGLLVASLVLVAVAHPLGLEVAGRPVWDALESVFLAAVPVGLVSLGIRFRSARTVERLQLRLVFWAAAAAVVLFVAGAVLEVVPIANAIAFPLIPIGVAAAVLRHRLYDIDRIISRTIGYALVTAILAGVYAALVTGVGVLVPGQASDLLVAGSTLVVAAVFRPVRSRVQGIVDRRFNRSRVDAQRAAAEFGGRLREHVDLVGILDDLDATVARCVQPARVTVWLPDRPVAAVGQHV